MGMIQVLGLAMGILVMVKPRPPDDGITGPILELKRTYKFVQKWVVDRSGVKQDLKNIEMTGELLIERNSNMTYRYFDRPSWEKKKINGRILEFKSDSIGTYWIAQWDSIAYKTKTYYRISEDSVVLETKYEEPGDALRYGTKEIWALRKRW